MAKFEDQALNIRVRQVFYERINPELFALFSEVPVSHHSNLCLMLMERCLAYERQLDALKNNAGASAQISIQSMQAVSAAAPVVATVAEQIATALPPSEPASDPPLAQVATAPPAEKVHEVIGDSGGALKAISAKSLAGFTLG